MPASAPTTEIGYTQPTSYNWWLYENETTPELVWPQSVFVYDQMRRTDSQVGSILRAVTLLVLRTPWRIDPNGARPEVVQLVADDLGLPIVGQGPKAPQRTKDRFSWSQHLQEALLMLPLGHSYFEQVYRVDDDGKRAHLRKLALRPAKSIERIDVAPDGGLISITQWWTANGKPVVPIPVDRLVGYIHAKEGGNWLGTSILRNCYKNWLLKDRLLRVQAQTIERNGMGIPLYTGQEDASEADLEAGKAMAKAWRAGEAAGSSIPFGATLKLVGVEGTLPDAEPAIRYHDESIAKTVLAHFLNLGQQMGTGSYALGTTLGDFFTLGVQTVAQQIADIANQHAVEDLVDVNWGPNEPAPRIVFDEIGSRQAATAAAIKTLVDAGVIEADAVLEQSTRQQYGLPPKDADTVRQPPNATGATAPDQAQFSQSVAAAADGVPAAVTARFDPHQLRDPHSGEWIGLDIDSFGEADYDAFDTNFDARDEQVMGLYGEDQICLSMNERLRANVDLGEATGPSMTDDDYEKWGPDRPYDLDALVDEIDRAVARGRANRDVSLWRGVALTPAQAERFVPGASVVDDGFMSTSMERAPAEEFAATRSTTVDGAQPFVFQLLVKKGTPAAPVPDGLISLAEIMLDRQQATRVVSREGNRIVLEVL